jgi:hypothetical protein
MDLASLSRDAASALHLVPGDAGFIDYSLITAAILWSVGLTITSFF